MARIAIIGGGSMGEALLSGLLRAGRQVKDLVVAERVPERARYLAETYSVLVTSVVDAAEHATYVIVAVEAVGRRVGGRRHRRSRRQGRVRQRRAGLRHDRRGSVDDVLRVEAAGRVPGDPGDAQCARCWSVPVSARWLRAGSPAPSSSGRYPALFDSVGGVLTVPEKPHRRRDGRLGLGSGVLLPVGRGAGRRGGRRRASAAAWPPSWRRRPWRVRRRCCWNDLTEGR